MIKKQINTKKKDLSEMVNLIPMINLIFLLLIFFLLTGVISKKDSVKIDRPQSYHGEDIKIVEEEVLFTVNNLNEIIFQDKKISLDEIIKYIEFKDAKYTLNIDKSAKISTFNEIIKKLKNNDIKKVFIKVSDLKNE